MSEHTVLQSDVTAILAGQRYQAEVPDTLDLTDRAALAIRGIGGILDPDLDYTPFWNAIFCTPRPHLVHLGDADVVCQTKGSESFPMLRLMCGSDEFLEEEAGLRRNILHRIQEGLYWDFPDPRRPWRNQYGAAFYGEGKDEDFAVVAATGRAMRALVAWRQAGAEVPDELLHSMIAGMRRVAIDKDDYSYYPEKGGWSEPCTFPRSGWLNTDESGSDIEGCEGSVTAYHGHQIYAAAQWYAMSGDPPALELGRRLTNYCLKPCFWGGVPDEHGSREGVPGHVAPSLPDPPYTAGSEQGHWFSHFHARAIPLRGMLAYGRVANDERVLEFVRRAYEFTLTQGIPRMGWINCYPAALEQIEGCALGDMIALGIRLSDYGLGDYWDDVDAFVRNQLVEQQFTRADLLERAAEQFVNEPWNDGGEPANKFSFDNVFQRSLGLFGGTALPTSMPRPWSMFCCTGNATQGLYYAWEGIVREDGDRAQINLLLNRAAKLLDIDSYLPYEGKVVIKNKCARRIAIRIPAWTNRRELRAEVNGQSCPQDWIGSYLIFDGLQPGQVISLHFPVTETTAKYTVNAHSEHEQVYTCTFRAGTLVDISPRDESPTSYPLYLRDHLHTDKTPMKTIERFVADRSIKLW